MNSGSFWGGVMDRIDLRLQAEFTVQESPEETWTPGRCASTPG